MAFTVPPTQEIINTNKANYELDLNQTSPPVDKSFINVTSVVEGLMATGLYKYATDRAKANLALTASEPDLLILGEEFGITRKASEAAGFEISLPATNGTIISATISFVGDSNGIRYFPDSSSVASGEVAVLNVTSETLGVEGNLNIADTLTISVQIPGATTQATITDILNTGANQEDIEVYRQRVLFAIRGTTGGSNVADHKAWAEGVAGVQTAFPYSGKPFGSIETSFPGDRTVYIESTPNIQPDGIPPQSLLDEIEDALITDPVTGEPRTVLGLERDNLYVDPITRTGFYITVTALNVGTDVEAEAKTDVDIALNLYFSGIAPFVEGIDSAEDRNDLITSLTISNIVQDVLSTFGGTAESISFGLSMGSSTTSYVLEPGNLAKLIQVDYV